MTIYDWVPIRKDEEGNLIIEWDGDALDSLGFLKEDILSLSQLDKIKYVLELIKKDTGDEIDLYKDISLTDEKILNIHVVLSSVISLKQKTCHRL